jgi:sulfur-oxidizing protein SoxZ
MSSIRIKAKERAGVVDVKALMKHPMETGLRKNKDGNKIPPHFIQEVVAESNGAVVFSGFFNTSISKDPYLSFQYGGKKGDKLTLSWTDNQGQKDAETVDVG